MTQLTVRNVPEEVVKALRVRAAGSGRSAEAEHRLILAQALGFDAGGFWERAEAVRKRSKRQRTNSAGLQREMRDKR